MELIKTIFQAWKVMEDDIGHGKSWEMVVKLWNFAQIIDHNVKAVIHYVLNCQQLATTLNKQLIFCHWQSASVADGSRLLLIQCQ